MQGASLQETRPASDEWAVALSPILSEHLAALKLSADTPPNHVQWKQLLDTLTKCCDDFHATELAFERVLRDRDRLSMLLSAFSNGMCICDETGTVTFLNPAGSRLLGLAPEQSVGFAFTDRFLVTSTRPSGLEPLTFSGLRAGPEEQEVEGKVITAESVPLPISGVFTNIEEPSGIRSWIFVFHDDTDRVRMMDELKMSRDSALESARVKADFLANMSHEIRTPLNGVVGMTGLLLDTELSEEQREYARVVRTSADSLLQIINHILDYSKIEAGRLELEVVEFDIRTVVEEVGEIAAGSANEKGIELVLHVHPSVPRTLRGDPARTRQVLLNLVANSIKFTSRGEVVATIELVSESDAPRQIVVSVRDTGIGIPTDRLHRLFQPFTQVDASTTRRHGGTGLGLAICKDLVTAMGGTIEVKSEFGVGSTFRFTLPLLADANDVHAPTLRTQLVGARALVVDDNAASRARIRALLSTWGMDVSEAHPDRHPLDLVTEAQVAKSPFALVVLDHHMLEIDGLEFGAILKADKATQRVRTLLMSTTATEETRKKAVALGFAACVSKPVKEGSLHRAVMKAFGDEELLDASDETVDLETPARLARILVVDDNVVNQRVAGRLLEKAGHRCDFAANGREALECLMLVPYDLVLMDCQMPEMDGYQASREIRRRELENMRPRVPIIAMTAKALKGDRERCIEAGMDDYISKPVQLRELRTKLNQYLAIQIPAPQFDSTEAPPIEFDRLRDILSSDPDALSEILDIFIRDTEQRITRMRTSMSKRDLGQICEEAHALKGAAANVGATSLFKLAAAIEKRAKGESTDLLPSMLISLESTLAQTIAAKLQNDAVASHPTQDEPQVW